MPQVLAVDTSEIDPILILEDLTSSYWPPPWQPKQVDAVLDQIERMHNTKVNDVEIEAFKEVHGNKHSHWQKVAANPEAFLSLKMANENWLNNALPSLLSYEANCQTEGECLSHWDLRSDNICLKDGNPLFIDWNHACLANPKLDVGFWLPSLAYEGGPTPENILPHEPEIAAWVAGFFAARAGLPIIPNAPSVRTVQKQQLSTALSWVIKALDLQPLDLKN